MMYSSAKCPRGVDDYPQAALEYVQNPVDCDAKALDGGCAETSDISHSARVVDAYLSASGSGNSRSFYGYIVIISDSAGKRSVAIYVRPKDCGVSVKEVKIKPQGFPGKGSLNVNGCG